MSGHNAVSNRSTCFIATMHFVQATANRSEMAEVGAVVVVECRLRVAVGLLKLRILRVLLLLLWLEVGGVALKGLARGRVGQLQLTPRLKTMSLSKVRLINTSERPDSLSILMWPSSSSGFGRASSLAASNFSLVVGGEFSTNAALGAVFEFSASSSG